MENYRTGYSFEMTTGELLGTETVYLEKATGTYPCATNVTFRRPPELREHECAVWNKAKDDWDIVADFRGMSWWNADGSFGGIIERLGDVDKITEEPPKAEHYEVLQHNGDKWEKKLKEGWIKDKGTREIREMTQVEKIYAGLEEIPEGCKLVNGELQNKTRDDLWEEGAITIEEYNKQVQHDREREYRSNTDKIGLMVLRGEATMEDWQAAIAEVKSKWPYKEA